MSLPFSYNFVETGKSPLLSAAELERIGFKLAIYPVSALLTVSRAVGDLLSELKTTGTTAGRLDSMVSLQDCFESVGLSDLLARDERYSGAA